MPNLTLEQILNRTEAISYSKNYKYVEQTGLNGKPTIVSGNENLKIYPLKIKLHHSFCNPQLIIDEIERKAQNREIINYFQNGKYIGEYVISNFNVNIIKKTDDVVLMADLEVNLLEKYNPITSFVRQLLQNPKVSLQKYLSTSNIMKNFSNNMYQIYLNNIFDTTNLNKNTNLSANASQVQSKLASLISESIKSEGVSNANKIIKNYTQSLNLSQEEEVIIKNNLEIIPKKIIQSSIRQIT